MSINAIHENMLNTINDTFDKSNGGFTYDVTRSIANVVNGQSEKSNETIDKLNVDNLTGEELTRFVFQRAGITRKEATFATTFVKLFGNANQTVSEKALLAADEIFYETKEASVLNVNGEGYVEVMCQLSGPIGNVPVGAIKSFPVTIAGVTSVINENAVTNGYAAESDEDLRKRYYDKLQRPGKAGNKYHYEEWAKEVIGVGKVKVYPLWDGPLTIKVVIVDANIEIPSEQLINDVLEHIESERPFGAIVTVTGATSLEINVRVDITVQEGLINEDVKIALKANIKRYLKSLAFESEYVSRAQIGKIILETEGIVDYVDLRLNEGTSNIEIPDTNIPTLGTVTLI
ncbi:baseplate J/gp47 family protein [Lysinibacillus fusiformis]|uniref:Uncharacterized phage protein gp47/JayE n=1 Tax=Lysinibacillus fusiformis TaxID=28031 RepID=A0A1H9HAG4_9BACI|nr:baseplate J/gp47 family protein [Lysinibacillus fusiformis]SCY30229.1 Uncharacterized phage protein gp47/JayE [Lysinibacillus fusiformis]SEN53618.1 Uncharacterized phage protein gp47/JayE [Lysinibacillus fusiformis]SEQ59322.1 Uncharacterized phage protein gp47/JayE [Lysinibacillus fusiformis]